jgi:hypothetical protein
MDTTTPPPIGSSVGFTGAWTLGNQPEIPEHQARLFIVTTESAAGKRHSFQLSYLNRFLMELNDDLEEPPSYVDPVPASEGEYYFTGWFEDACESCETSYFYSDWEKIIAFTEVPILPVNGAG